jgi:protein-S-isoprenylcysteine O-methyltransferase Ste14
VIKDTIMAEPRISDPLYWIVFRFVFAGWFTFAAAFLIRKRPANSTPRIRNNHSIWGILVMGTGMALVWWIRRPVGTPFITQSLTATYLMDILACGLIVLSIWLILAAIRLLGKQWNVRAIVVEQHQLITTGPYAVVRHPIYTGMFGLMLSTGIANSYWFILLAACVLALIGTLVRIRQEELLLQQIFGGEYEVYQNRVPAFFPWFHTHGHAS